MPKLGEELQSTVNSKHSDWKVYESQFPTTLHIPVFFNEPFTRYFACKKPILGPQVNNPQKKKTKAPMISV